ncbi:MAG: IS110 family transposase [Caldilineaceae bacterium]|nr:IS110 family transposase [Caldilineaceae bacterium]
MARGAGLDVHRDSIVAVVLVGSKKVKKELRTFGTTSGELAELRQWLQSHKVTHVAMEATGVYWLPVVEALEGQFELVVANAHQVKNMPGRKTDACDAEWLATLLRFGLINSSFVPPAWQRQLGGLTRSRSSLTHSITRQRNMVLKLLESVGIKLAGVLSDVFGVSGMAMLRALRDGNENPELLSGLAKGRLRKKTSQIVAALKGRTLAPGARIVLAQHLQTLDLFDEQMQQLEAAIDAVVAPYSKIIARLRTIPGVNYVLATVILAEVGPDVAAFPTCAQFAAWSGTCPGNARSAKRSKAAGARKGNVHLTTALVQAAVSASRAKKPTFVSDKYHRIKTRRGPKRAALAGGHKIAIALWHMLHKGEDFHDLGPASISPRTKDSTRNNRI